MSIYAIGDLQGCHRELEKLLEHINYDDQSDTLWFAGDLVNRGPQSLQTLRFVKSLGDNAITVLGNHDLHLLAVNEGIKQDRQGYFSDILSARDRDELIDWLRRQPLIHFDKNLNLTLLHAGLPPQWSVQDAIHHASELEAVLRSDDYHDFISVMYGDQPDCWSDDLQGRERLRFICNCFTRLRYCDQDGRLRLSAKHRPDDQHEAPSNDLIPWFAHPHRRCTDTRILFGHWSTLGDYHNGEVYGLDTGCVWGGQLTALKIEGNDSKNWKYQQIQCAGALEPGESNEK